jgi:hypothetical protein
MSFRGDADTFIALLKLEPSDQIVLHGLRGKWTTDEHGKAMRAQGNIVLDLHNSDLVTRAFCLYREDVLRSSAVDADRYLVRLHLAHIRHGRPQVVVQRVAARQREMGMGCAASLLREMEVREQQENADDAHSSDSSRRRARG